MTVSILRGDCREILLPPLLKGLRRNHYACVLCDPPWHFKSYTAAVSPRAAGHHYRTLSVDDLCLLPVSRYAAKNAHLFLWTTGPFLPQAMRVIDAWGFRYSGVAFTWIKLKRSYDPQQLRCLPTAESDLHVGLGFTTRKNAEFCLLARRGNARRAAKNVREVILAPVREHSRKPDEAHERIERYCDGPRLELFARARRKGWACRGDQVGRFTNGVGQHARHQAKPS